MSTSQKAVYIERFNKTVKEFLVELCRICPNVTEFTTFHATLSVILVCNVTQVQHIFDTYVASKYRDHILNKDESFFLNEEYVIDGSEYWKSFIDTLCNIWKDLSADNKDVIWQYFRVLIVLNDKYKE